MSAATGRSNILLNDLIDKNWPAFRAGELLLVFLLKVFSLNEDVTMTDVTMNDIAL